MPKQLKNNKLELLCKTATTSVEHKDKFEGFYAYTVSSLSFRSLSFMLE